MSYTSCANNNSYSSITDCISNKTVANNNAFNTLIGSSLQGSSSDGGWNFNKIQYANIDNINTFLNDQQIDIIKIYDKLNLANMGTNINTNMNTLHNSYGKYSDPDFGSGVAYDISGNLANNTDLEQQIADIDGRLAADENNSTALFGDETALYNQQYIITISMIIGCIILIYMFVYLYKNPKHV